VSYFFCDVLLAYTFPSFLCSHSQAAGAGATNDQLLSAFRQLKSFDSSASDEQSERTALIQRYTEVGAQQILKKQKYLDSMSKANKFGKN
jgi:hypothetical protein